MNNSWICCSYVGRTDVCYSAAVHPHALCDALMARYGTCILMGDTDFHPQHDGLCHDSLEQRVAMNQRIALAYSAPNSNSFTGR